MTLRERAALAEKAARAAGEMLLAHPHTPARHKAENDFVTEFDVKSEELIRGSRAPPCHGTGGFRPENHRAASPSPGCACRSRARRPPFSAIQGTARPYRWRRWRACSACCPPAPASPSRKSWACRGGHDPEDPCARRRPSAPPGRCFSARRRKSRRNCARRTARTGCWTTYPPPAAPFRSRAGA